MHCSRAADEQLLLLRIPPASDTPCAGEPIPVRVYHAITQSDDTDAFIEYRASQKEQKAAGLINPGAAVANGLLAASLFFTPVLNVVHSDTFSAGGDASAQVFGGGHASRDCAVQCMMAMSR